MKKTPMLAAALAALAALTALTGAAPAAAAEIRAKFRGDWCEFPATVPVEGTTIYLRGRCPEPSIGWMKVRSDRFVATRPSASWSARTSSNRSLSLCASRWKARPSRPRSS
jgi:hypothetical protein